MKLFIHLPITIGNRLKNWPTEMVQVPSWQTDADQDNILNYYYKIVYIVVWNKSFVISNYILIILGR